MTQSKNWSILSLSVLLLNLTIFYLVCPSKTILRNFSSCGEVLPPLENFLFKKCSGTGKYSYIFTTQQFHPEHNIWRASFVQKIGCVGGGCCFFSIDFIINTKTINPILSGNFSEHTIWRFSFVQKMGREGASCLFSIDFVINTKTVWIGKMQ